MTTVVTTVTTVAVPATPPTRPFSTDLAWLLPRPAPGRVGIRVRVTLAPRSTASESTSSAWGDTVWPIVGICQRYWLERPLKIAVHATQLVFYSSFMVERQREINGKHEWLTSNVIGW
jgi:hypothetical protein